MGNGQYDKIENSISPYHFSPLSLQICTIPRQNWALWSTMESKVYVVSGGGLCPYGCEPPSQSGIPQSWIGVMPLAQSSSKPGDFGL